MINSDVFNYVNVFDKAADAAWVRNEAISNNIANATTPGYKRQDVAFEAELQRAMGNSKFTSLGDKVGDLKMNQLEPRTRKDYAGFAYRLDGNNVDVDTESVMLAKNQTKYNALIQCISGEFSSLKSAMK